MVTTLLALQVFGCARYETRQRRFLPADGVWSGFVDDDRGDLSYEGRAEASEFELLFASWGRGGSEKQGLDRAAGNRFDARIEGALLDAWGRSEARRAGVDIDIWGPRVFDVEALTLDGTVTLRNVDGFHYVTGSRVEGRGVFGDLDALATDDGMDVVVVPYIGSVVRLEVMRGDLEVALPAGLPYDLRLVTDAGWGYELLDLGFDEVSTGPSYAFASTGEGTVTVELINRDGPIFVTEAVVTD